MKKFIVLVLSLVLVLGLGVGCNKTDETLNNNADIFFEPLSNVEDNELRISLCAEEVTTNSEYIEKKLTATLLPKNAIDKKVDWSIAWENGPEDDISNYLIITPESDGSLTLYVRCYKAFNNYTALITCTTRSVGLRAQCRVVYRGHYSELEITSIAKANINKAENYYVEDLGNEVYFVPANSLSNLGSKSYCFQLNIKDSFGNFISESVENLQWNVDVEFIGKCIDTNGNVIEYKYVDVLDISNNNGSSTEYPYICISVSKSLDIGTILENPLGFNDFEIASYENDTLPYFKLTITETTSGVSNVIYVSPISYNASSVTLPESVEM